ELTAALALDPGNWPLALRLGTAFASLGPERQGEAMDCFRRVIALSPGNAIAHLQLGLAFWRRGDAAPAIALGDRAARLDPKLAWVLAENACREEARAAYRAALELFPDDPVLRLGATMATLPIVADDPAAAERCRAEYAASLADLEGFFARRRAAGASAAQAREDAEAVGTAQPFFLAYQGGDDKPLQARYGGMVAGIMGAACPQWAKAAAMPPPGPSEPIRI